MENIDDIIEYENEGNYVDFKAIQYEKHDSLIKDIIAIANAFTQNDRYIIIGIKHSANGNKEFIEINDIKDEANYQQLINSNVEPEINFNYVPYQYKEHKLAVFHIYNCLEGPYMMKKQYGKLNIGDIFIRKGSTQMKASKTDLDKIYYKKIQIKKLALERQKEIESKNLFFVKDKFLQLKTDCENFTVEIPTFRGSVLSNKSKTVIDKGRKAIAYVISTSNSEFDYILSLIKSFEELLLQLDLLEIDKQDKLLTSITIYDYYYTNIGKEIDKIHKEHLDRHSEIDPFFVRSNRSLKETLNTLKSNLDN